MRTVFIVGNSRSGTTMLSRILGRHSTIHTFQELHFFEELYENGACSRRPRDVLAELFAREREGYLQHGCSATYREPAAKALEHGAAQRCHEPAGAGLLELFLEVETFRAQKQIACEQTPGNVYHIGHILREFADAVVIGIVRDPRDVLLSQKNRWKRRRLGAAKAWPRREALRVWANYHPLTISLLWRSGMRAFHKFGTSPRLLNVRFENLVHDPETTVRVICDHIGIAFEADMLAVAQLGSSNRTDQETTGISPDVVGRWKHSLPASAVWLCERINGREMENQGYKLARPAPGVWSLSLLMLLWPVKVLLSLFLNRGRTTNLFSSIRRRL